MALIFHLRSLCSTYDVFWEGGVVTGNAFCLMGCGREVNQGDESWLTNTLLYVVLKLSFSLHF